MTILDKINVQRGIKRYTHVQETPSTDWTVAHNLNSTSVVNDLVIYHGTSNTKILPKAVDIIDANTISIKWSTPRTGTARIG